MLDRLRSYWYYPKDSLGMIRSTDLESQIAGSDLVPKCEQKEHFRKIKSPFTKKVWVPQPVSADMIANFVVAAADQATELNFTPCAGNADSLDEQMSTISLSNDTRQLRMTHAMRLNGPQSSLSELMGVTSGCS
jgi:hypothetical protein